MKISPMSGKAQTATKTPADAALQDEAKASHAKPDPTGAAKASDELSEDNLEAVAGGTTRDGKGGLIVDPLKN